MSKADRRLRLEIRKWETSAFELVDLYRKHELWAYVDGRSPLDRIDDLRESGIDLFEMASELATVSAKLVGRLTIRVPGLPFEELRQFGMTLVDFVRLGGRGELYPVIQAYGRAFQILQEALGALSVPTRPTTGETTASGRGRPNKGTTKPDQVASAKIRARYAQSLLDIQLGRARNVPTAQELADEFGVDRSVASRAIQPYKKFTSKLK
jgi:hypothetical protein